MFAEVQEAKRFNSRRAFRPRSKGPPTGRRNPWTTFLTCRRIRRICRPALPIEAVGLDLPVEVRPHPRLRAAVAGVGASAPLLTNPPWVRSLGKLGMEVTTQGCASRRRPIRRRRAAGGRRMKRRRPSAGSDACRSPGAVGPADAAAAAEPDGAVQGPAALPAAAAAGRSSSPASRSSCRSSRTLTRSRASPS